MTFDRVVLESTPTVVFEPAPEGGYTVTVPVLPRPVTEGDTLDEARAMVKDAIRGYPESLIKHVEKIPVEPSCDFGMNSRQYLIDDAEAARLHAL